jgi:STE24 endopeptidase
MEETTLDLERQEDAKEYAGIRRRLMLANLGMNAGYTLLWLAAGWALWVKDFLLQYTTNDWLLVAGFAFFFGAAATVYELPMSYYSGFVLPHRYGMSNQSLKDWILDNIKGLLVAGSIGLLMLESVYFVLRIAPEIWWLLAAGFLLVFNVILGNLFPVLIAPLFNKYTPLDEQHADLADRLVKLAQRANTPVMGVYKFDLSRQTNAANAALAGIGNTRRIILGDTLINEFSADEIETVLAHELGHQVNKDIPLGIAFGTVSTLAGLYLASLGLQWGVGFFGFESVADIAALPLFGIILGAFGLVTMPLGNAFSRWRERKADAYALQATNNAAAFASAMTRLANQNLADVEPPDWVEFLLHSHPALSKRIAAAEAHESFSG